MIPYFRIKTLKIYTLSGSRYLAHIWIEGPTPGYSDIGELLWNGKQREKVKGRIIKRESFPIIALSLLGNLTVFSHSALSDLLQYADFCWVPSLSEPQLIKCTGLITRHFVDHYAF